MCDRIQDGCETSNAVRCGYRDSAESTRKYVGCGVNEDVMVDEWGWT